MLIPDGSDEACERVRRRQMKVEDLRTGRRCLGAEPRPMRNRIQDLRSPAPEVGRRLPLIAGQRVGTRSRPTVGIRRLAVVEHGEVKVRPGRMPSVAADRDLLARPYVLPRLHLNMTEVAVQCDVAV